jgi:glycosyltransferase involved in cell wall biosynthesis
MKIWFAAAIPPDSFGGVARSIRSLSEYLKMNGHKTKIIYAHHPLTKNYLVFSFKVAILQLLHCFSPPDWIIARSSDGLGAAIVARLFRMRTKIALHNHGWEEKAYSIEATLPRHIVTNPTSIKAHLLRFPLLRLTMYLSNVCISGTIDETRWLKKGFPSRQEKLTTIPNGVTPPPTPYWPSQQKIPLFFLTIGAFTWKKNLEYALLLFSEIYQLLPSAHLFCVGTDSTQSTAHIDKNAVQAITFINKESPDRIMRWYEECPFLLSTSRYEGGRPFTLLEAQSRGMVVCSVSIPSSRELITHNKSGILVNGMSAGQDANTIVKIISDEAAVRDIGIHAWKKACRNRWERQILRLNKVLQLQDRKK